eukprot:3004587-Heterocapsa_arctica.AAC.1
MVSVDHDGDDATTDRSGDFLLREKIESPVSIEPCPTENDVALIGGGSPTDDALRSKVSVCSPRTTRASSRSLSRSRR